MSVLFESFLLRLRPYQDRIEKSIQEKMELFGDPSPLQQACAYAMSQGGKRFRPALVMMVASALPKKWNVLEAALAVEYFHNASLIADDLPCMDNDAERRGKPALHRIFGQATALLASYALISAGYEAIAKNTHILHEQNQENAYQIGILALQYAAELTGIGGTVGGQYLDLFSTCGDFATYADTTIKKTVSLFEISLLFGWLFGGGGLNCLPLVRKAASSFGLAFQIRDDQEDIEQDRMEKRPLNAFLLLGKERAESVFQAEIRSYLHCLEELDIASEDLKALASALLT